MNQENQYSNFKTTPSTIYVAKTSVDNLQFMWSCFTQKQQATTDWPTLKQMYCNSK